jgi:hypothetical protein
MLGWPGSLGASRGPCQPDWGPVGTGIVVRGGMGDGFGV